MKKLINSVLFFTIVLSIFSIFENNEASAHPSKKHKPMVCVLEEDRTEVTKRNCKALLFIHRLCKAEQDCAIIEIERKKKELK